MRERAAAAEARVRGAEEAAKAAQEEARRAGTLASREIAELHEKLRAARQSGSDAASEAVQRAEALLRESQAREAAQKKRADELTEHMLKLSERLEASDATIKQLKLLKAELEATAQAREADIESVRAQMVAHAEAAGKRDGERIAAISRLEAALGTANAEVHAAREQLGRGVEEAQRRMREAGEALETARAREAAAAAEELRAAREREAAARAAGESLAGEAAEAARAEAARLLREAEETAQQQARAMQSQLQRTVAEVERMKLQLDEADRLKAEAQQATLRAAEAERSAAIRAAVDEERARSEADKGQLLTDLDARLKAVSAREAALGTSLKKVLAAEEAMEACLTCMSCLELLKDPMTCTPCGHTFCSACLKTTNSECPECGGGGLPIKLEMLGTLTSKFEFQKQTLNSLHESATTNAAVAKFAALAKGR
jgi:predicted Zn-ribbon and HTH transcriptional regulator